MNNYTLRLICFGLRMQKKLPLTDILPMFPHSLPLQPPFPLNFPKHQATSQTCSIYIYPPFCNNHSSAPTACARSGCWSRGALPRAFNNIALNVYNTLKLFAYMLFSSRHFLLTDYIVSELYLLTLTIQSRTQGHL